MGSKPPWLKLLRLKLLRLKQIYKKMLKRLNSKCMHILFLDFTGFRILIKKEKRENRRETQNKYLPTLRDQV